MLTVLIMAGGSGQRFWPLSTPERPKQLLNLVSNKTMIRTTVDRILPLVTSDRIFIATNIKQEEAIKKELDFIPEENIIIEPAFKDTAAAIGYGSLIIEHKYPDSQIIVLASDHLIEDEHNFRKMITIAVDETKENNSIVTLGIKPNKPETGYGYIQTKLGAEIGYPTKVERFCEKPDLQKAKKYIEAGNYLWNSGMFIFKTTTILKEIEKHMSNHFNILMRLREKLELGKMGIELSQIVLNDFKNFEKISIDYGVMEKTENIKVIPVDFGWNDIGSFTALQEVFSSDEFGTVSKNTQLIQLNSTNNIVLGNGIDKMIATIGVSDIVIVQAEDKLLICHKDEVQNIKKIAR